MPQNTRSTWAFLPGVMWGVLGIAVLLRAPVTAVAPALPQVRRDLSLTAAMAGATTSLPLICFGVFAFATPFLVRRWGLERTTLAVLTPIAVGVVIRSTGSATAFFVGSLLLGVGIAIGNVLAPALIRSRFAGLTTLYMGLYTGALQFSAAAGSALTAPLQIDLGWGWNAALGIWVIPAISAWLFWVMLLRRGAEQSAHTSTPAGLRHVAARPQAWAITLFMGVQSAVFYSLATWLPAQLITVGLTPAQAGLTVGAFSLIGLPTALLTPRVATGRHAMLVVAVSIGSMIGGIALLHAGTAQAVVGVMIAGAAQGAIFSIALTYIADQPNPHDVPALSALAQGIGYITAGLGPVLIGTLAENTGGWIVPNTVQAAALVTIGLLGAGVGRSLYRAHAERHGPSSKAHAHTASSPAGEDAL